jgi:filamentous hemagglutinin family protein
MIGCFSLRSARYQARLAVSLPLTLLLSGGFSHRAVAQSVIPAIDGTGTQVILNGNQFNIDGGSLSADQLNLFHSFQEFGLTQGQIANFLANPSLRNIVTRVGGGNPSFIDGLMQVTGGNPNLFLMNPSGVVFGPNAQLNLPASFAATTADGIQFGDRTFSAYGTNDYATLLGDPIGFSFGAEAGGLVINSGDLSVATGESLTLLGGTVVNTGQLSALEGQILVTSVPGESVVRLTLPGYILEMELELPPTASEESQTWQLPITALPTLLTEGLTPEMLGLTVTDTGTVELAHGVEIPDSPGTTMVSGSVDVSGDEGGSIAVLGDRVGLVNGTLDASGTEGGGTILIGGDYRGNGIVPNAQRTYVDATSTLSADADTHGDGGTIIVWADEATGFYGNITATGGELSGNGGFAEVSGKDHLVFKGHADLSSPTATHGTLLLDPTDIIISNLVTDMPEVSDSLPDIFENEFPNEKVTINQATLQGLSGDLDIILQASNNITVESLAIGKDPNGTELRILEFARGTGNITLQAGGNFSMPINSALIASSAQTPGSFSSNRTLTIQATNVTLGDISTRGGVPFPSSNVVIKATGIVETGDIATFADSNIENGVVITDNFFNGGNITITGINEDLPDTIDTSRGQLAAGTSQGSGGNIFLEAEGDIKTSLIGTSPVATGNNTQAGNITISSQFGSIDLTSQSPSIIDPNTGQLSSLLAGGAAANGGNIKIEAPNGTLITPSVFSGATETGGSIVITAPEIIVQGEIASSPSEVGTASGNIELNGNVIFEEYLINQGPNQVPENNALISTKTPNGENSGGILINGNINGNQNLSFDAGQSPINFRGSLGTSIPLRSLQVNSESTTTLNGDVRTANGDIIFNSSVDLADISGIIFDAGAATVAFNNGLTADNTTVTINADDVTLAGTISGSNTLTIQPTTDNQGIALGSNGTNTLNLDADELATLQGFSNVIIGGGSGDIAVNDPTILHTPTRLGTTGNININDTLDSKAETTNNLSLNAGGNIAVNGKVGATQPLGDVTLESFQSLTGTASIDVGSFQQVDGFISSGNINLVQPLNTNGGDVRLSTTGSIAANTITTDGGDITLSSTTGPIENVAPLSSASATGAGGDITITNPNAISIGDVDATGATTGGNITLQGSTGGGLTGTVTTGNLIAKGADRGGNVTVLANDSITAGAIDTSATQGNGGNVLLDPFGNIQVSFIDAQGGTTGFGGDVTAITTGGLFRAIDSFPDQNGVDASISAAGGAGEGRISIFHSGGDLFVPFFVAFEDIDITVEGASGTVGALTTGNPAIANNIISGEFFLGTEVRDQIGIFTSDRFTNTLNQALPDTELEKTQIEDAENQPFWLDEYFTRRTENYLGFETSTPVRSLEQIQDDLRRIEEATGVKPAVIYVVFEPEEVLRVIEEEGLIDPEGLVNQGTLLRFREEASDRLQLVRLLVVGFAVAGLNRGLELVELDELRVKCVL